MCVSITIVNDWNAKGSVEREKHNHLWVTFYFFFHGIYNEVVNSYGGDCERCYDGHQWLA